MGNEKKLENPIIPSGNIEIRNAIHLVRGRQVMLDFELAMLYQVETKRLNERVKRNQNRFPESFCFQLTKEEFDDLRSQSATSSDEYGGRRYRPYAFTEQGIAMLSSVLNSDVAIDISIKIMDTFVEMRKFIASNSQLFERISSIELRQLEYQKAADEKFSEVFNYIADHAESEQKMFFDGQIYDAFSLITKIIGKAKKEIVLIDGYVDINTLNLLAKKKSNVKVIIHTYPKTKLTQKDIDKFNSQYPTLTVSHSRSFHDRFIILDGKQVYHIGASIKDAGLKCFAISRMQDENIAKDIISRL